MHTVCTNYWVVQFKQSSMTEMTKNWMVSIRCWHLHVIILDIILDTFMQVDLTPVLTVLGGLVRPDTPLWPGWLLGTGLGWEGGWFDEVGECAFFAAPPSARQDHWFDYRLDAVISPGRAELSEPQAASWICGQECVYFWKADLTMQGDPSPLSDWWPSFPEVSLIVHIVLLNV